MIRSINNYSTLLLFFAALVLSSCVKRDQSPGFEYMPDMYRSPAIEVYVDYGEVRDTLRPELMQRMSARQPVEGTVPMSADAMNDMPYPYANTQEGYEMAGAQLRSPLAQSKKIIDEGTQIYANFCVHCHGAEGQGNGAVVEIGGHPAPQAYNGPLKNLPEGKMFHTLTYGKGNMGSHASQLTKLERWKVVAYVKTLQKLGEDAAASDSTAAPAASDSTSIASTN